METSFGIKSKVASQQDAPDYPCLGNPTIWLWQGGEHPKMREFEVMDHFDFIAESRSRKQFDVNKSAGRSPPFGSVSMRFSALAAN